MDELVIKQQYDWALIALNQSKDFMVKTQLDYDNAAELCKDIKNRVNQITDYWKPLKEQAQAAHKSLCAKEKELLEPFTAAETDLKTKMTAFQRQKMEEERLLREEQERWKKEEADRFLKAAIEAEEKEGKTEHSEYLLEVAEQTANMVIEQPKAHKTEGTAAKTVWKARVVNPALVPITIFGAIIRPIDEKVLNDFARTSRGSMKIPGVEFYEDIQIAIRTR